MMSQVGTRGFRRFRKPSIPRRRRRARKGHNIRPLEQWAINNLSEMALIIRPPALRSFDRTESSATANQSLLYPGWIPAGDMASAILFKGSPSMKSLIPLAYSKIADGLERRFCERGVISLQTLHRRSESWSPRLYSSTQLTCRSLLMTCGCVSRRLESWI